MSTVKKTLKTKKPKQTTLVTTSKKTTQKNSVTKEKKIIIIPTWRSSIKGKKELNDNKRIYSNEFKKTEYCIFYNELINNERLLYIMKYYNYTGTL